MYTFSTRSISSAKPRMVMGFKLGIRLKPYSVAMGFSDKSLRIWSIDKLNIAGDRSDPCIMPFHSFIGFTYFFTRGN
mgnify:CR=1 FL=1